MSLEGFVDPVWRNTTHNGIDLSEGNEPTIKMIIILIIMIFTIVMIIKLLIICD